MSAYTFAAERGISRALIALAFGIAAVLPRAALAAAACGAVPRFPGPQQGQEPTGLSLKGRLMALGSPSADVLYLWEQNAGPSASETWRSQYVLPDGSMAAQDELTWNAGQVRRYRYERTTSGERSMVERDGDWLVYTRQGPQGTDCAREAAAADFLAGSAVIPWVQTHWTDLMAGRLLHIRYGVLDQLRSYEFDLAYEPGDRRNTSETAVIRMQLSNGLLRLFFGPIDLLISRDGLHFRGLAGRVLPVVMRGGSAQPVDAELVVTSETAN